MSDLITAAASVRVAASPARVFEAMASMAPERFVRGHGLLPGVARSEGAPRWRAVGDARRLTLDDGAMLSEELTAIAEGRSFTYRAAGFTGGFAALVDHAIGDWRCDPVGERETDLVWTYAFAPKNAVAAFVVRFIAKAMWPGYMSAALARVKAEAEKAEP